MHVHSRLFAREEVEAEAIDSENGRTHELRIMQRTRRATPARAIGPRTRTPCPSPSNPRRDCRSAPATRAAQPTSTPTSSSSSLSAAIRVACRCLCHPSSPVMASSPGDRVRPRRELPAPDRPVGAHRALAVASSAESRPRIDVLQLAVAGPQAPSSSSSSAARKRNRTQPPRTPPG